MKPEGQRRLYVVRPEGFESVRGFMAEFWPESLERLRSEVRSRKRGS
jgi:hypothetical protein